MKSINKIFIEFDQILKQKDKRAKELNWHAGSNKMDYDPESKTYKVSDINPLFYETTQPDHNGNYIVFVFKTENKYPNNTMSYRDVIMNNSELRKTLYKDDDVEVGITIEKRLRPPTDTCWGYSFHGYDYYIIKNGETYITQSRANIRKVYNNKPIKDVYSIRVNNDVTTYSREVLHCEELGKNVYLIETTDEDFIAYKKDNDLWEYILDNKISNEWWIGELGGIENMLEMILDGHSFDPMGCLRHHHNFDEFIPFTEPHTRDKIDFTNMDIDKNVGKLRGFSLLVKV